MPRKDQLKNLPHLKGYRRALRKDMTPAEATLWNMLRNRQYKGLRFRRQFSIGNFIVDFCCPKLKLVIELDGEVHNDLAGLNWIISGIQS